MNYKGEDGYDRNKISFTNCFFYYWDDATYLKLVFVDSGWIVVRTAFRKNEINERYADLLSAALIYGSLANVFISILLLILAINQSVNIFIRQVELIIGFYYLFVGTALYFAGFKRHFGFIVFSLFGIIILLLVWLAGT